MSSYESWSNYLLQTIKSNAASQKFISYFSIKQADKTLKASNLLNHQFETSLHGVIPFEFCTRGAFMFLKHFLFICMYPLLTVKKCLQD